MKKLLLLFVTLSVVEGLYVQQARGQLTLTFDEVYNYDPGDIFLTRSSLWPFIMPPQVAPPVTYKKLMVLSKTWSSGSDTVFYNCSLLTASIVYPPPFPPINGGDTTFTNETIDLWYTNLNNPIQTFPFGPQDPCYADSVDTVFVSDVEFCNRKVYHKNFVWGNDCFEPPLPIYDFVEGCGGPYTQHDDYASGQRINFNLIYFRKGTDSCGTNVPLVTGLKEKEEKDITITLYPNPASTHLTVVSELKVDNGQLTITNTLGQLLYSLSIINYPLSIDVSDLSSGLYYLHLQTEQGTVVNKFIRQ